MATLVIMPRQGISVESCIVTRWHKAVGDPVAAGDLLFSYETDKAAFDEAAAAEGTLLARFHEEGDDVPVLLPMAVIGQAGEDVSALLAQAGGDVPDKPEAAPAPAPAAPDSAPAPAPAVSPGKTAVSPRASRTAERLGVDAALAAGTGPEGRVIERDVLALPREEPMDRAPAALPAAAPPPAAAMPAPATAGGYADQPLTQIRKVIARQMHASLSEGAQLTHHMSFDATSLMNYRKTLKEKGEALGLPAVTLGDLVCYGVSRVLPRHPALNAHFLGDRLRVFEGVNLGVAVDTDRGLMVPTLMGADRMTLLQMSAATKALAADCRAGSVNPDLLQGGTFTVSNLGALGVELFTPVLNPPQTGILGVCAVTWRPRPDGQGGFAFYPAMGLSLTYDHRALDGAPATRFLKELCETLGSVEVLLTL